MADANVLPLHPPAGAHYQVGIHRDPHGKYVVTCSCGLPTPGCHSQSAAAARWRVHLLAAELEATLDGPR